MRTPILASNIIAAAALVIAVGSFSDASAIGMCEDNPLSFTLQKISPKTAWVLVEGDQAYCDVVEDADGNEDEQRGSVVFSQLRHADKPDRWFLPDLKPATRGRFGSVPKGAKTLRALPAATKTLGLVDAKSLATSPAGACKAEMTTKDGPEVDGEFQRTSVSVTISSGGRRLLRRNLGDADAAGGPSVDAFYLPARKSVLLWFNLPECNGPPPGSMYGGGDCYPDNDFTLEEISVKDVRKLAACFQ